MKTMKKTLMTIITMAILITTGACSDDDTNYPVPIINGNDLSVNISRDTANVCMITRQISSEAGLVKVELKNKTENTLLDEVNTFNDPNNYTYSYTLDLSPYTESTTLPLVLSITDREGQTSSQEITIHILVTGIGINFLQEGELKSKFEDFNVATTVRKGEVPLQTVAVYVGDKLNVTYDLSSFGNQKSFDLNILVTGLKPGSNTVRLVTKDKNNQESTVTKVIHYEETNVKWQKLSERANFGIFQLEGSISYNFPLALNGNYPGSQETAINDAGKLNRLVLATERAEGFPPFVPITYQAYCTGFDLEYNNEGQVSRLTMVNYTYEANQRLADPSEPVKTFYEFTYTPASHEVSKVTKNGTDYLTDFRYIAGNISHFKIEGTDYTPRYIVKEGEAIRVDQMYGELAETATDDFTVKRENPLYIPQLPAVLPLILSTGISDMPFSMFFYNKYIFETAGETEYTVTDYRIPEGSQTPLQTIEWNMPDLGWGYRITYLFEPITVQ